jgi:hypothetical protein
MKAHWSSLFAAGSGVLLSAGPLALGQSSDGAAAPLAEVVVTGSRIPIDPNLTSSTPVQFLDE